MSQISLVYDTLKQCLREQRITYRQLANTLDVSEASVKRNFSLQAFSLDKLEQICESLQLSLSDLFQLSQAKQEKISQLSVIKVTLTTNFLQSFLSNYVVRNTYDLSDYC